MKFLPKLKEFLATNRRIYTVRKYNVDTTLVRIEGVGLCRRTALGEVDISTALLPFYKESGFSTLSSWLSRIRRLNPEAEEFYLYRVEVLREE